MLSKNLNYELELFNKGKRYIAGVDEVGRGCLAGPMVVGAVILDSKRLEGLSDQDMYSKLTASAKSYKDKILQILQTYTQIDDSKLVNPVKRRHLSNFITKESISYSIEVIEPKIIDKLGISKCTQKGFYNAVKKLSVKPDYILTDAFRIKRLAKKIQTNIKRGDRLSITIAAASIIAKVFRDNLMTELHNNNKKYRPYRFDLHKGYGTKLHLDALQKYGPSDIHRYSFEPVKHARLFCKYHNILLQ